MLNGDLLPEFPELLLYKSSDDSISKISLPADYSQDFSGLRAASVTDGRMFRSLWLQERNRGKIWKLAHRSSNKFDVRSVQEGGFSWPPVSGEVPCWQI